MALLNDRDILLLLWHYWNIAGVCNILCTVVSMYLQQSSSDFVICYYHGSVNVAILL